MFVHKIVRFVECHMNKGIFAGIFQEVKALIKIYFFFRCDMQTFILSKDPKVYQVYRGHSIICLWGMPKPGYTVGK